MEKLVPVKSCILTSGINASGEQFHSAKITLALGTGVTGVISTSVAKAGSLPASWRLADGVKPSVSTVKYEAYDESLKAFVKVSSPESAHRVERLVALGWVGVKDADLSRFSVVKTEQGKNGNKVVHLRRTVDGPLHIVKLPTVVEEAGVCLI